MLNGDQKGPFVQHTEVAQIVGKRGPAGGLGHQNAQN